MKASMWLQGTFLAPPTLGEDLSFGFLILGDLRTKVILSRLPSVTASPLCWEDRTWFLTLHILCPYQGYATSFSIHDLQGMLPHQPRQNERSQHNLQSSECLASARRDESQANNMGSSWRDVATDIRDGISPPITFHCLAYHVALLAWRPLLCPQIYLRKGIIIDLL